MTADASTLLEPDEPCPVRVLRESGRSDFVLLADHAGKAIPRRLAGLGVARSDLERHIAWDIGIAGVTERLSAALDAPAGPPPMMRTSKLFPLLFMLGKQLA